MFGCRGDCIVVFVTIWSAWFTQPCVNMQTVFCLLIVVRVNACFMYAEYLMYVEYRRVSGATGAAETWQRK